MVYLYWPGLRLIFGLETKILITGGQMYSVKLVSIFLIGLLVSGCVTQSVSVSPTDRNSLLSGTLLFGEPVAALAPSPIFRVDR